MEWYGFEIKEVWRTHQGTVRGLVQFQFEMQRPGKAFDDDWPVSPTIDVTAYVTVDPASTYEEVEQALLAEARRLLKEAIERSGDAKPLELRKAVENAQMARERRTEEESNAQMAEALRSFETE